MSSGMSSSESDTAYMLWMIPSWRSLPIRSRSSIDGEPADRLVQPSILDRDPRVQREQLDEPLIVVAELGGGLLVGQVEVADDPALDPHRHAEQRSHRWVLAAESRELAGCGADVGDPERAALGDDQPEEPMALAAAARDAVRCSAEIPLVMKRSMRRCSSTMPSAA